jgi:FkbM family methyltransferase
MSVESWLIPFVEATERRGVAADIGANVGSWTSYLSRLFDRVIAYEADERAFAILSESPPPRSTCILGAICGSDDPVTFYLRPSAEQSSLLAVHPIGGGGGAPAPAIGESTVDGWTLDRAFPGGADLVKMDIEGGEIEALRACQGPRWRYATFIVECHDTFDGVEAELQRIGLEVTRVPHPYSNAAHPGHCWAVGRPISSHSL